MLQKVTCQTHLGRHIQWYQSDWHTGTEHHVGRMRIDKDIKLSNRTDIAWHANRSTHDHEAAKLLHEPRSQLYGTRDIRERSQGNQGQVATVALHHLQQTLHRLPVHCWLLRDRITRAAVRMAQVCHPSQTVIMMKGCGRIERAAQWAAKTLCHCRPG